METVITILIVAAAGLYFFRWFRGTAKGEGGCGCGCSGCGVKRGSVEQRAEDLRCGGEQCDCSTKV